MARCLATFVTSATAPKDFPPESLPEIAVVGRSNVGKSSLINALTGVSALAKTSRTPGRTRLLNWFSVSRSGHDFFIVDLPGYGFAEVNRDMRASWQPLIESYLSKRKVLKAVLLLVDIRRGVQEEELDFVPWLEANGIVTIVALTKADKLPKNQRQVAAMKAKKDLARAKMPTVVSASDGDGIDELWKSLGTALSAS